MLNRILSVVFTLSIIAALGSPASAVLVAQYDHDGGDPLTDDSGNGNTLANAGGVTFGAPISPGALSLGTASGDYSRVGGQHLDPPGAVYVAGTDFTFTAMVRKNADESGGHQTILGSDRFRFQFQNTGGAGDGGQLRLDVNNAGAGGASTSGSGSFQTEQWQFVAMTYDTTTNQIQAYLQPDDFAIFRDPVFTRTANGPGGIDDMTGFQIGSDSGASGIGGADGFGGQIDGSRFYNTVLSEAELISVYQDYNTGFVPLTSFPSPVKLSHEGADPLDDDLGFNTPVINGGGVSFVAPPAPGNFAAGLGNVVGAYSRSGSGHLTLPDIHEAGDDFTFIALARKNADETGGHQSILTTNRFRLQYQNTGGTDDGGQLRLDINTPGATGTNVSGAGTFGTEIWYFVAMRYDATTKEIEVFFQDDALDSLLGPVMNRSANGIGLDDMDSFRIGADGLSGIGGFDAFGGWIDNAMFFDRFVDDAELQRFFTQMQAVPEPASALLGLAGLAALGFRRRR